MALTNEEKQELLNAMKAESQGVDELEQVDTLDGIMSLPALRGEEVVSAPIKLLTKPAEDAVANAVSAANRATEAAQTVYSITQVANSAASAANAAASAASDAAEEANSAVAAASEVVAKYENVAKAAFNGATARFSSMVESATIQLQSSIAKGGVIVYVQSQKQFAYYVGCKYYGNWAVEGVPNAELYRGEDVSSIQKNKVYLCGDVLYVWSDEENDLVEISGSGGGNTYNVTEQVPLENGYYTLATAIKAVEEKQRAKGRCITYEVSQGKWETKQFIGTNLSSWESISSWEVFGGAVTVKIIPVNGTKQTPDSTGNVNVTIKETEVDESLDANSTNPVQNSAVTAKLNEVEANTIFGGNAELSEDESTVHLTLTNKSGAEVVGLDIPAGKGGGGGETSTTKIVLGASVNNSVIKEGGSAQLTYSYDHQYSSGDEKGTSTGQKATIEIEMKRGSITMYHDTIEDVSKGSYTLDLSKYLQVGTTDIYVKASTTDPTTGKKQMKQSYVSVKVVTLSLTSSFNLAEAIAKGGYGTNETISIPYAISGSGTKVVTLYVDGKQQNAHTITRSGTTNSSFSLSMTAFSVGRHTIQMVAEMEASADLTLKSDSIYMDILKTGSNSPFIGTMMTHSDGRIFTKEHLAPTLEAGQYEQVKFEFVAYDPTATPADVSVYRNDIKTQNVSVPRTTQIYTNRFLEKGTNQMKFKCGVTDYNFYIDVNESGIDLNETTSGLQLKLTASGRSNSESTPSEWTYNGIRTTFNGFDWKSNGWTGDALKLTNGANIEIGYTPFKSDATTNGATYEMELMCSNVTDRNGVVIDCMNGNVGFKLTTQEAIMRTGAGTEVNTLFASGLNLKIAFVVQEKSGNRLLELYVNGILCGAKQYANTDSLLQSTPVNIKVGSDSADVELRNIRVYNRALGDDEELANYMVDRPTTDEMVVLFENNQVMNDEGTDVDMDKLRAKGKSVMRIVGDVNLVNQTNNKKFEVPVDIYFYSAYGKEYDFIIYQCGLRIQGTSSTTYPRKNYRLYFSRSSKYGTKLYVNGVECPECT